MSWLSIAYFAPIATPNTIITIPILLIKFSPINFSISDFIFGDCFTSEIGVSTSTFFSSWISESSCPGTFVFVILALFLSVSLGLIISWLAIDWFWLAFLIWLISFRNSLISLEKESCFSNKVFNFSRSMLILSSLLLNFILPENEVAFYTIIEKY